LILVITWENIEAHLQNIEQKKGSNVGDVKQKVGRK
jgi:tetrahydromethanopterin S-methyltransferase subunit G